MKSFSGVSAVDSNLCAGADWGRVTRPVERIYTCDYNNVFGTFSAGGGCNAFGCYYPGGNCNAFGCYYNGGQCNAFGCIREAPKTKLACNQ